MEAKFLTDLDGRDIDDGRWELLSDLKYQCALIAAVITVPKGFVTDFASVPRLPIVYMLFGDRAHREAVIHDYLYQTHLVCKSTADRIFLEAMRARSKGWWISKCMYLGVVLGGRSSYASGPSRYTQLNDGGKS